jgi:uncharacterized protein YcbX
MATLSHIAVYPVKALDPVSLDSVGISEVGGLDNDRAYALCDAEGEYVNGKRTDAVHRIRSTVDIAETRVTLRAEDEASGATFHLDDDRDEIESWLSEQVGIDVELDVGVGGSLTDGVVYGNDDKTGPTLVSQATLAEVASWYEGITPEGVRRRMRPNLVVEGVPAFWEDRLFSDGGRTVRIGHVELQGTRPIPRCVVPTRDQRTGETDDGFRERFVEKRESTLPEWTDQAALDGNFFTLTAGLRIPESERDGRLAVGDEVHLLEH